VPPKKFYRSFGNQFRALKEPNVKSKYKGRELRMRRPLPSIGLKPAIQKDADRAEFLIKTWRRVDFVVTIDTLCRFDTQPGKKAETTDDLNMVS